MGQGTETTRHRRKKRGNLFYTVEFHVSDHFSVDRINSCIQHNCATHYHIGGNPGPFPETHHRNNRPPRQCPTVPGIALTHALPRTHAAHPPPHPLPPPVT